MMFTSAGLKMFLTIMVLSSIVAYSAAEERRPLFYFDKGGVGVNFLGFKASAGLGGLLTGNSADGGLHAEAGTPFGQRAAAGLGGTVGEDGRAAGGLYAGATAGGGVRAAAGLGGIAGNSGSVGGSFAGASSGPSETHITKIAMKGVERSIPENNYYQKNAVVNFVEPAVVEKTIDVRSRVPASEVETVRVRNPNFHGRVRVKSSGYVAPVDEGQVTVSKAVNPDVVNDIFNIPISTLEAVRKLLGGIASNSGGTVSVSKTVSA